jgi:hypothetical protein
VHNSAPNKPMCLLLFGITLTKSARTILAQFRGLLESSKYFHKVKKKIQFDEVLQQSANTIVPYVEGSGVIEFPNSIMITFGSQIQHSIGEDLFGCIFDEAEYRLASTSEVTTDLYLEVSKRIQSRFIGKRFIMVNLVSSIRNEFGVIAQYIKNGGAGKEFTRISSFNMWEFQASCGKLPKEALTKLFYVMRGTKTHPSKILDEIDSKRYETGEFKIPPGCEVLSIPTVYYDKFKLGVNKSLMDIAGVSIQTMDTPFDDLEGIQDKNLMSIITIEAPLMSDEPLVQKLPKDQFIETPYGMKLRRYPEVKRYMHIDLATTGEAGIAMVHKERFKTGQACYVVDFCIRIISPDRISLEAIQKFIVDLKRILAINLEIITADQYQSAPLLQYLEKNRIGKEVRRLSVDRTLDGYNALNSVISEKVLRIGQMHELASQLHNIYFTDNKPYVHVGRKDLADALCGAVFNSIMNSLDTPINPYFSDQGEDVEKFDNFVKKNFTEIEDI